MYCKNATDYKQSVEGASLRDRDDQEASGGHVSEAAMKVFQEWAAKINVPPPSSPSTLESIGGGLNRIVYKIQGRQEVIKCLRRERNESLCASTQRECIAYEISRDLGFYVVPPTQPILPNSEEEQICLRENKENPVILQDFINECEEQFALHIEHAHKVIFFNWITGRSDKKRVNSVIDPEGRVWEVDNEFMGGKLLEITNLSHWLFVNKEVVRTPIDTAVLDWVVQLPDQIKLERKWQDLGFQEADYTRCETFYSYNLSLVKGAINVLRLENSGLITFKHLKKQIRRYGDL